MYGRPAVPPVAGATDQASAAAADGAAASRVRAARPRTWETYGIGGSCGSYAVVGPVRCVRTRDTGARQWDPGARPRTRGPARDTGARPDAPDMS
ncbi:hypothetical protein SAV31267_059220 [Streptomyces avermitilis]|uniref:Uncharacterized protein n=1 Tax=Streptomyces avermitilis TaxID=33903 RepID=A0A4D4MZL7_STRAX|nr:hypothetical protein SAV31267_059220 [Streptomyces avermitilis]